MEYNQSTVNYWKAFVLPYTFALEELKTKFEIMNREAQFLEDYNPFEHIKTRLKQPESIIKSLNVKIYYRQLKMPKRIYKTSSAFVLHVAS